MASSGNTGTSEPRARDAQATRKRILKAAKKEFARHGLAGARVDVIADRAKVNKRMIYHYFASKDGLFGRVLEGVYVDIRTAEQRLNLDALEPRAALERLVRFTWDYFLKNPEFITLVNGENLHKARHLKTMETVLFLNRQLDEMVSRLLKRGVKTGVFRRGVDAAQLNITIAAIGYYYHTNRYTGSIVFGHDFMAEPALKTRLKFNIETIMRLVCKP